MRTLPLPVLVIALGALCAHCASAQQPEPSSANVNANANASAQDAGAADASSAATDGTTTGAAGDAATTTTVAEPEPPPPEPEAPAEPEPYSTSNDAPPPVEDPGPAVRDFRAWLWTTATSYGDTRFVLRDIPAVPAAAVADPAMASAALDRVVRTMLPVLLVMVYGYDEQAPASLRRPSTLVGLQPLASPARVAAARRALAALARDAHRATATATAAVENYGGDTNTAEYASVQRRQESYEATETLLHETLPGLLSGPPAEALERAFEAAKAIVETASHNDLNGDDTHARALGYGAEILRALAAGDHAFAPVPSLELRPLPGEREHERGRGRAPRGRR